METFSFGNISPLRCGFNRFALVAWLSFATILAHNLDIPLLNLIMAVFWLLLSETIANIHDTDIAMIWNYIPSVLMLTGLHIGVVPLMYVCLMLDQQQLRNDVVRWVFKYIGSTMGRMAWPSFGYGLNSGTMYDEVINDIKMTCVGFYEMMTFQRGFCLMPTTYGTFIRSNSVAAAVELPNQMGVELPPGEVLQIEKEYAEWWRRSIMLALLVISLAYMDGTLVLVMGLCMLMFGAISEDNTVIHISSTRPNSIQDGVYRLTKKWLVFPMNSSIGVTYQGVMHGTYHGCSNTNLVIGHQIWRPFYVAVASDLITWGGLPKFTRPENGEKILVNREHELYQYTMEVDTMWNEAMRAFTWLGQSQPGESGSPIWLRREGVTCLAGQVGRWAEFGGVRTEISVMPPIHEDVQMDAGVVRQIIRYPGWGKTRKEVPSLVMNAMHKTKGRIFVVGPTRVVAGELYRSLSMTFSQVGLMVKNESMRRNFMARIQITTHATFIKMIATSAPETSNIGTIIIDEAHVNDTSTLLCREYAKFVASMGGYAYEMSATLDGQIERGSNYRISDHKIRHDVPVTEVIRERLEEGKRVLVFTHGAGGKDGIDELAKEFSAHKPIKLSRATLHAVKDILNDQTRKLILSTNIAECGMNIEADVVVDTGVEFDYFANGHLIEGHMVAINEASRTQRRGRVGRKKPGDYYYYLSSLVPPPVRACEYEANILMAGRKWNVTPVETHLTLTEGQFIAAVENGWNPNYVAMTHDTNGLRRKKADMAEDIRLWLSGSLTKLGCSRRCVACAGEYSWFDERHHAELLALKNGQHDGTVHRPPVVEL